MPCSAAQLSFAVIVETENLQLADISGLRSTLESLSAQDGMVQAAESIMVQDSGNVDAEILADLKESFPWITFFDIPHEQGHYEAKMNCMQSLRSDIIVFCDSDCVVQPGWLANLLQPFHDDRSVQVVGGETKMEAADPFSLAMVLTHVFDLFSANRSLYSGRGYYANNVAFRRELLQQTPIPGDLPLFRGNCCVHARQLMRRGIVIWRQPQSRALHATPEDWSHFAHRFVKMGSDAVKVGRLTASIGGENRPVLSGSILAAISGKLVETASRTWRLRTSDPQPMARMVLAIPIVVAALGLYTLGAMSMCFSSTPPANGDKQNATRKG